MEDRGAQRPQVIGVQPTGQGQVWAWHQGTKPRQGSGLPLTQDSTTLGSQISLAFR
jgi:hypothetical protein